MITCSVFHVCSFMCNTELGFYLMVRCRGLSVIKHKFLISLFLIYVYDFEIQVLEFFTSQLHLSTMDIFLIYVS